MKRGTLVRYRAQALMPGDPRLWMVGAVVEVRRLDCAGVPVLVVLVDWQDPRIKGLIAEPVGMLQEVR